MELDKRYNHAAPNWRQMLTAHGFPTAYRHLATHAPQERAFRMIDVGAGSGDFSKAYCEVRQRPLQHTLLDRADAMLTQAKQIHPDAETLCEDLAAHSPVEPYHLTLCAHVIEHCPCPEEALRHVARITAPGGTVLLAVSKPHFCQVFIWLKWQHRWYSEKRVQEMASAVGLTLKTVVPFQAGVPARVSRGYVFIK